ncbi:uncharacterized protein V6R79_010608 [Siganus canaliculatus]
MAANCGAPCRDARDGEQFTAAAAAEEEAAAAPTSAAPPGSWRRSKTRLNSNEKRSERMAAGLTGSSGRAKLCCERAHLHITKQSDIFSLIVFHTLRENIWFYQNLSPRPPPPFQPPLPLPPSPTAPSCPYTFAALRSASPAAAAGHRTPSPLCAQSRLALPCDSRAPLINSGVIRAVAAARCVSLYTPVPPQLCPATEEHVCA